RLLRRRHREDDEIIDLALVLRLHPLIGIEGGLRAVAARHDAGDLARQVRNVEGLDPARAARALEDALPGRLDATAEWRHHAEAWHDDSSHVCHPSPLSGGLAQEAGRPSVPRPAGFIATRARASAL